MKSKINSAEWLENSFWSSRITSQSLSNAICNALMKHRYGSNFAYNISIKREYYNQGPQKEETMDLHNNSVGRRVSASTRPQAAKDAYDRILRGEGKYIKNNKLYWTNQ